MQSQEEFFASANLYGVVAIGQRDCLSNGRDSVSNCPSLDALSLSEASVPHFCYEACERAHPFGVGDPLKVRVQAHRFDIFCPIVPMCFPILGSRCHLSIVIACICNA
jgi:hypothetical protein